MEKDRKKERTKRGEGYYERDGGRGKRKGEVG